MSEAERKRRLEYRKNRKKWIILQLIVIAIVSISVVFTSIIYFQLNKTVYIDYTEASSVDYKVKVDNSEGFYDSEWLDSGRAYLATHIKNVATTFSYKLTVDADDVDFDYSYKIEAQIKIIDDNSKKVIYDPVYELKPLTQKSATGNKITVTESAEVDYNHYNQIAQQFIGDMSGTTKSLIVRMKLAVAGNCEDFSENSSNDYKVELVIPLMTQAVNINMTTDVPTGVNKVMACNDRGNAEVFKIIAISCGGVDALLILVFVAIILLTRNDDINYEIKIKRLLSAYKSYIQKITNTFSTVGYKILNVETFNEMLAIRDTIQSPILMCENEDKTLTQFLIPTNTEILYVYEIRVEDYDEIYNGVQAPTMPVPTAYDELAIMEVPLKEEVEVIEQPVADGETLEQEPIAKETIIVSESPVEEVVDNQDVEVVENSTPGTVKPDYSIMFGPKLDISFEAKLAMAGEESCNYYAQVIDFVKSYGVKVSRSWKYERISANKNLFALMTFKGKKVAIALAMDPATADEKYHAIDVSNSKKFAKTPMLMRISSQRKVKFAVDLLTKLFTDAGLVNKNLDVQNTVVEQKTKDQLFKEGLIKIEG